MPKYALTQFETFNSLYVASLRSGDPVTEEHFATYFSKILDLKLNVRFRNTAFVQDVRQETLRRVLETIRLKETLRDAQQLGAFVNSVCKNVLREHWRAASKVGSQEQPRDLKDHRPDPEEIFEISEEASRLHAALLRMPKKQQRLLTLLYFEERDYSEVSRQIGVNRGYLRVLAHRAILELRHSFFEYGCRAAA
jgi:RNA polymerase sigma-70 factor, ECF subfamily